ncbi:MAG: alpha-2,8-polysialyltransferase family protein, partial [Clostridiales Family XIII bacterium]|nr:alpha-2,8-polysialyltransferase family protein [Clostridiales Family XIII bacterium]
MKSIFVMTYYHLLHAAALAMTFEERPALYVEQDFLKISDAFLERIRATDIFAEVHGIRKSGFVHAYNAEIVRTKDLPAEEIDRIGTDIFERWLEPFYARVFADADEDETFYSYNDHQSCIYYIHKHFRSIVGVEDGYKVLESKIAAAKDVPHDFYVALSRFYGKYYPEPMWKNSKVERILSSCAYGGDDPYYRQRVEVLDFFDLVEQNRERFLGVLGTLFDLPEIDVPERSSLVLTQPLARAGYCTLDAYYLLLRKLIRTERARGNAVYLKPHPAEELHMGMFRHEVDGILPKEMPSEVLNYLGARFGRGVSFNSASLSTADYLAEAELLYREKEHTYEGFQRVIQQYVRGERIWLDLYVKVRKLEPGRLVDALSCLKQGGRIRVRVHIVLSDALFEEGVRYFSAGSVGAHVREYLRRMRDLREPVAWRRRLLQLDAVASRALA